MIDDFSQIVNYDPSTGVPLLIEPHEVVPPWPEDYPFRDLPTFEIGLVLAGAISAGAYIGGVLDYFFEALDAFEAAKREQYGVHKNDYEKWEIPAHNVRLKVIAGASAGGMTGAIVTAAAQYGFPHIRDEQSASADGAKNPFYNAWVREIDISDFLGTSDLADPVIHSLFDCSKLDTIVKESLSAKPDLTAVPRPWLADPFKIVLTVTNLRGIPYQFGVSGSPNSFYAATQHADTARFSLSASGKNPARPNELGLRWGGDAANWTVLGQAALASGSFPVALRSRTIFPPPRAYEGTWIGMYNPIAKKDPGEDANGNPGAKVLVDGEPQPVEKTDQLYTFKAMHMSPSWGNNATAYSYASADGGIINNVPLDHARVELSGIEGRNPRNAKDAMRAVILIDPLPEAPACDMHQDSDKEGLVALMGATIDAMKNQARFHPEDIKLAADSGTYSRFMLNPHRMKGTELITGAPALACGGLGGFSGFLDLSYRHHDFILGRLNCESFLRNELALAFTGDNTLFGKSLNLRDPAFETTSVNGVERVIIPLTGALTVAENLDKTAGLAWPVNRFFSESIRARLTGRMSGLADKVLAGVKNPVLKFALNTAWKSGLVGGAVRREAGNGIINWIHQKLLDHKLVS